MTEQEIAHVAELEAQMIGMYRAWETVEPFIDKRTQGWKRALKGLYGLENAISGEIATIEDGDWVEVKARCREKATEEADRSLMWNLDIAWKAMISASRSL